MGHGDTAGLSRARRWMNCTHGAKPAPITRINIGSFENAVKILSEHSALLARLRSDVLVIRLTGLRAQFVPSLTRTHFGACDWTLRRCAFARPRQEDCQTPIFPVIPRHEGSAGHRSLRRQLRPAASD